jgi:endonuclease/exonuclease/phosphatase family metal-dependent hydrolase
MRILTYNVHSCRGTDGVWSPDRIAEVISATRADVVCLQELDVGRARSAGVHQAEVVARALAMDFHFFPVLRVAAEEYGDAILSRLPMQLVRTLPLPGTGGAQEPRGALWVEVEERGARWQVLNTHFGLGRTERRMQARALAVWVREALRRPPVVLCGDLNSRPGSFVHSLLGAGLRGAQSVARGFQQATFATRWPWICLDYVYASPDLEIVAAEVVTTPEARLASDHFPLLAQLRLPSTGTRE